MLVGIMKALFDHNFQGSVPHGYHCGYFGDFYRECNGTPSKVQRYRSHISGPLMDRIDLHIEVPAVKYKELGTGTSGESSHSVRQRVEAARVIQAARLARIIVDLEGSDAIAAHHVGEAIGYRALDRAGG